jgi:DNA-binding NarL/FixJ family response regulator
MNHLPNSYGIQIDSWGVPAINFGLEVLTEREKEVVRRVLLPGKNIAFDLNISEYTVNSHLTNIRNKTGLQDMKQLVYFGTKTGIIN